MRKPWKTFWVVTAFAAVAIVAEGVILSGRDLPPPPGTQPVVLGSGGVTAHHMSNKSWSLYYDHAQTSPDGSLAEIDGIHNGVLYRQGKPYITLSAKHVSVNTISDDFTATGDVHITQVKAGLTRAFDTDLVVWTNATKIVTLSHPSVIKTGDATMTVQSMTFNVQTGAIHLGKIGGRLSV
ncbi:MAG: LPS export ABC transporter periplasmic protein LptC [Candidatus Eremiobacteraeota bacterium]|nr:LPS export ABC transporter periplasmic protein LptC [Candidatus Eremiobacteraeota bacterium]